MYIVLFYEEYVGNSVDEYSKIFESKAKANQYKNKLNKEFAEVNRCKIENLGDYYIVEEIEKGD